MKYPIVGIFAHGTGEKYHERDTLSMNDQVIHEWVACIHG